MRRALVSVTNKDGIVEFCQGYYAKMTICLLIGGKDEDTWI